MDASEYKEYIFGMLFLKRLNDQFAEDRQRLRAEYEAKGLKPALVEKQLANVDKYDFFVPDAARWSYTDESGRNLGIAHLKTSVGSGLNKALAALKDANPNTLQDVLRHINFNRKIGQRTLEDSTLVEFIQQFTEIPPGNDDFEFPDLLGKASQSLGPARHARKHVGVVRGYAQGRWRESRDAWRGLVQPVHRLSVGKPQQPRAVGSVAARRGLPCRPQSVWEVKSGQVKLI